ENEIVEAIRRARRGQMSIPAELGLGIFRDLQSKLRERIEAEGALREVSVVAAVRDMTAIRDAEEVRRKSEQLFRGLLESAPDAMVVVDGRGRIQVVNSRTEQL